MIKPQVLPPLDPNFMPAVLFNRQFRQDVESCGVKIGPNVKIQNGFSIYHGVTIEDGVFCGPHCVCTNDKQPRPINPDGSLKNSTNWKLSQTIIKKGTSIGANATIVCGITVGNCAMIGSRSVVSENVPDYALVFENPAITMDLYARMEENLT